MANEKIDKRMVKWDEAEPTSSIDPSMVRWQTQPQRAEHVPGPAAPDLSGLPATMVSLGRAGDRALAGVESLFSSPERQAQIAEEQTEKTRLYAPQKAAHPVADIFGQGLFYTMGLNPLGGAVLAGIQHPETGPDTKGERLKAAGESYIGGKIGQTFGKMVGRAITPADTVINEAKKKALKDGLALGYKAPPSLKTGSAAQEMIEAGAESNIFATGNIRNIKMWNQSKLNSEFSKAMGEASDVVDEGVVANALNRVQGVYRSIARPVPAQFNAQNAVTQLNNNIAKSRGIVKDFADHELVKDVQRMFTNGATQEQLVAISTQLRQAAESQFRSATGDRGLAVGLINLKNTVDDVLMEGLNTAEKQALTEARKNWKYILLAMRPGIVNTANGDVSGNALYNALKEHEIKAISRGADPSNLIKGAKMERAFPRAFGRSGTAERLASPSRFAGEAVLNKILYEPYFSPLGMMWAGNNLFTPSMRAANNALASGLGAAVGNEKLPILLDPTKRQE